MSSTSSVALPSRDDEVLAFVAQVALVGRVEGVEKRRQIPAQRLPLPLASAHEVGAIRRSSEAYAQVVTTGNPEQRHGEVFDAVADAYDRVRPSYPVELIETAWTIGVLEIGARALEIGCGTGKLTEALVERGLVVDAVDPGPNMIALAKKRVAASPDAVEFHRGRFEDVALPEGAFDAMFSATAFHWVDPTVGWAKAARSLRPGGTLALIMYISYWDEETAADDEALREVFEKYMADHGTWHPLRDLPTLQAGAEERSDNVSAVWTWLGHHDLTNPEAALLFEDVRLSTFPVRREQAADEVWEHFETTSSYQRLQPGDREALERETRDLIAQLGGTLRSSDLAVLVTAQNKTR